jgi:hypothetical protein
MQQYRTSFETLATVGHVQSNCNRIVIYNQSPTGSGINLIISGLTIEPGNAFIDEGNNDEFNTTVYNLQITPNPSPNAVIVVERKIYI